MSAIVGIDFSTFAIDCVLLDEDTDTAQHHRVHLQGPGKLLERVRRVRDQMPARTAWRDNGVIAAAIEEPFGGGNVKGTMPLLIVMGAIVATFPPGLPLALLRPDDWRKQCGLPIRAPRPVHKANAVRFAEEHWQGERPKVDDNAADAFGIAWAMRELRRAKEVSADA